MGEIIRLIDRRPGPPEEPMPELQGGAYGSFCYGLLLLLDYAEPKEVAKTLREVARELNRKEPRNARTY
jgi:hypothetical protein